MTQFMTQNKIDDREDSAIRGRVPRGSRGGGPQRLVALFGKRVIGKALVPSQFSFFILVISISSGLIF